MPLGRKVGFYPSDIVLDGDPAPCSPKRGQICLSPPNFQPMSNVYCGKTCGWMNMPLGMEVGLDPGDFVLDRDPAPASQKGEGNFRPISIVPKRLDGCIKMPLDMEVGLSPGDFVLDDL